MMGGAVILPGLSFGLGLLNPDGLGEIFPKLSPLEEHMLMIIPKTFASNVFTPQQAAVAPVFPGDLLGTTVRSDPVSYRVFTFPSDQCT